MKSALQKLGRADFHLNTLQHTFQGFSEGKPYRFIQREVTEGNRRYCLVTIEVLTPMPDELGLIVGDICNNLRSALDHLLWYLHLVNAPNFDRRVFFPIFDSEVAFQKTGGQSVRELPISLQALFEWAQPYKRGNKLLLILQNLNNVDKHRLIPILAATASFQSIRFPAEVFQRTDEPAKIIVPENQRIEDRAELIRIPLPESMPEENVNVDVQLRFDMVFGDIPTIAKGLNVGETLTKIRDEVNSILSHFIASQK